MKKRKTVMSLILSVAMLFGTLPSGMVFAADTGQYTVSLTASAETVDSGSMVDVSVSVTSGSQTNYNAFYAVLSYDSQKFAYSGDAAVNGFSVDSSTTGTLKISRVGSVVSISDSPDLSLTFTAKSGGKGTFSLTSAKVDAAANAEKDAPEANRGSSVEIVVPQQVVEISTEKELRDFAASVNSGMDYAGTLVTLKNDIVLSGEWTPAGAAYSEEITDEDGMISKAWHFYSFKGTFDGGGHLVSGLNVTEASVIQGSSYFGFFGSVENAEIVNLSVSGTVEGSSSVGGIAGIATNTSFSNCRSSVSVKGTGAVGGIVGLMNGGGVLRSCKNSGSIDGRTSNGNSCSGGIVGEASGVYNQELYIDRCVNTGNVTGGYAAGICGRGGYLTISECANKADIDSYAEASTNAAGIVAFNDTSKNNSITSCYNTGNITATSTSTANGRAREPYVCGISGYGKAAVTNCWSIGELGKFGKYDSMETRTGDIVALKDMTFKYAVGGVEYVTVIDVDTSEYVIDCYGRDTQITADLMNKGYPDTWTELDGNVMLLWETEQSDSDKVCTVKFEVIPSTAHVDVYKDSDRTQKMDSLEEGYQLSGGTYYYSISENGYFPVERSFSVDGLPLVIKESLDKGIAVSITVVDESDKPVNDAVVSFDSSVDKAIETSAKDGVFTYLLKDGENYAINIKAEGFVGVSHAFNAVDGDNIKITLKKAEQSDQKVFGDKNEGKVHEVTSGGTYSIGDGATGTLTIRTTEPVTLLGRGMASSDVYQDLTIRGAVPGIDLTVKDLYVKLLTEGTASGETTAGQSVIDVTGSGNRLSFSGENLFENEHYVKSAVIHVGKGNELTFGGDGTLYMYRETQGSGIGGSTDEAGGKITFESGNYFLKGNKTGAVIGGDAQDGTVNDDITINGGVLNLMVNAQGAAIGSSKEGSCAGNVLLNGGTVTITTDYIGSAIGNGGGRKGTPGELIVSGGSLKTCLTENSAAQYGLNGAAISDVNITAAKKDSSGSDVYRAVFDASGYNGESITVEADGKTFYSGGLHQFDYSESKQTTANWVPSKDQNLYLYLTGKDHTLKVSDGATVKTYDVVWKEDTKEFLITEAGVVSHTVTFTGEHAQAVVNGTEQTTVSVAEGDSLTFSIQADTGYDVSGAALTAETGTLKDNGDGTYTLSGLTGDTEVKLSAVLKQYPVEFDVTPKDAVVTVTDSEGNVIAPIEGAVNQFLLTHGVTYTYSATRLGYTSAAGTMAPTSERTGVDAVMVTLRISQNSETGNPPEDTPVWDGTSVDISWFDESQDSFTLSSGAQLAGLAALVNGLVNENCMVWDGSIWIAAKDWNQSSFVHEDVGDGSGAGGNNQSTDTYHYGVCNFAGKTVRISQDLDMTAGNYMPVGGQYLMTRDDSATKIDASFNGMFDGQGHNVDLKCNRWCSTGNFGDGQSVGLIGRLGVHDNDPVDLRVDHPTVKNVSVSGSIYANRSVGGIVGKVGKTTYSNGTDEYGGIIENCANYASVKGTDAKGTGGVVGASWNGALVQNCYNAGPVETTFTNSVGGISGSNEGMIRNCYNVGEITGERTTTTAIATENGGGKYENCHWLENSADVGVYKNNKEALSDDSKKSSDSMKTDEFVTTLGDAFAKDTDNINNGYPILKWQASQQTEPEKADKSKLTEAVAAAQADQEATAISADGSDVDPADQWVPQSAADALTEAVGAAQAVMENKDATQDEVDAAADALKRAQKTFDETKKDGTKADDHDASCPSKAFSDLDTSKWYHEAIDYVLLRNYFNGVGDGKFAPDGTMTRAMFVTVLGRAAGVEEDKNAHSSFGDVADGKWYTTYVDWAAQNDIVDGYDSKTFGPDDFITREQMAVILYRYARYKGVDVKAADAAKYHTFRDADQVSNYAKVPMIWATDKGIISGMGDGTLAPQKTATRAQVAQIVMNYNQKAA